MNRYRCVLLVLCMLGTSLVSSAQYFSFSTQPDSFAIDVVKGLQAVKLEATNKVAFDFRSAWTSKLTGSQKEQLIEICVKMRKRRMGMNPHYRYLFSLLTYAITQENANQEDVDNILAVIEHAVDKYNQTEVVNMCRTLTFFFGRGYLYMSKYNKLTTERNKGQYKIKLLEDVKPVKEGGFLEAIVEEQETEEEEEYISEDDEMFEANDFGGDDDWGADDGWSDDDSDDSWDDWGTDSDIGYLADEEEKPEFIRETFEAEATDLVSQLKAQEDLPQIGGAVIELQGMEFKVATPFDTIRIKKVNGTLMLRDGVFVGTSGLVDWPDDIRGTEGVEVDLTNFSFNIEKPAFKSTNARMLFPKMYQDSLAGVFEFMSPKRNKRTDKKYPKFTSFYADKEVSIPFENTRYKGGFGLWGSQMVGTCVSKQPSTLEVDAMDGRSLKTRAELFFFNTSDSTIRSDLAELFLYHNAGDSIYHPAVKIKYDGGKSHLSVYKDRGDYKNSFYNSSFFRVDFKADRILWDMQSDSLDISIMNGAQLIPVVFESEDFFNPVRFAKMSGLLGFHPVRLVVNYARKIQESSYNIMELVSTYHIPKNQVYAAADYLRQTGYIIYDKETGNVRVLRKAFHYVMSKDKKKDYDNFLVSSISPDAPNATLNFKRGEMDVRGVKRVNITPDSEVYIEPKDSILTLTEDKGMIFNGMVNAKDYQYKGKDFVFDYNRYLVDMRTIDSIRIQLKEDTTALEDGEERSSLEQHLEGTSGILYINSPNNKAGLRNQKRYPYFESDSEAIVYFDSEEVLDGEYDRSVYFVIPPFKTDTASAAGGAATFPGVFYSGIFPPIPETLHVMPDQSLGFVHDTPQGGYQLYSGNGNMTGRLSLDFEGLRSDGQLTYQTAEVNSNGFTFYMDSVTAQGTDGFIKKGQIGNASYPEAELKDFKMRWLPGKDSMYIENRKDPFLFYDKTASLDGKANITTKGVYGSGTMYSRGTKTESKEYHFESDAYSGRHAYFEVMTDVPGKSAMEGDDVNLEFDLIRNEASVHPEKIGDAAISFPYAQLKTSISNATWYLDSAKIYMEKPSHVDISKSYFYSTREDLDSLAWNASGAYYDMNTSQVEMFGVPYITVADARLIPEGNRMTVLENSVLTPFKNMKMEMDTTHLYHHLSGGNIMIHSRNEFSGDAVYHLVNSAGDTYDIVMNDFDVRLVEQPNGEVDSMSTAYGTVGEELNVKESPGFFYKGEVELQAANRKLYKSGYITPDFKSLGRYDSWLEYTAQNDTADVYVNINRLKTDQGERPTVGLFYDLKDYQLYMAYLHDKRFEADSAFFTAEGMLYYDNYTSEFIVEDSLKSLGESYHGKRFAYNDKDAKLSFEGMVDLIDNTNHFEVTSAAVGSGDPESGSFDMNTMIAMRFKIGNDIMKLMAADIIQELDKTDYDEANAVNGDMVVNVAQLTNDDVARRYEQKFAKEYTPLFSMSSELQQSLVLTNVKLRRTKDHPAWYSVSKIGLSNSLDNDINAMLKGFMEVRKDEDENDILNLFFSVSPSCWYYFSLSDGRLLIYSSNNEFNTQVAADSKVEKVGFGEYTIAIGDEFEVLDFIDGFRSTYLGINENYQLDMPDEAYLGDDDLLLEEDSVEDEEFLDEEEVLDDDAEADDVSKESTEEEDEDDGF